MDYDACSQSHTSSLNPPAINSIPHEIFRRIIQLAYTTQPGKNKEIAMHLPLLSPVVASHVCRVWRYALLSDPTMWVCLQIPKFKACQVEEFIRRSNSTPALEVSIELTAWGADTLSPTFLSSIFQQIHRFRAFKINIHLTALDEANVNLQSLVRQVLKDLQRPAPELQEFIFSYHNGAFASESIFIDTLFAGHTPNLKYLRHYLSDELREIAYPFFRNARNLSELRLTLPDSSSLDLDRFLDLLEFPDRLTLLRIDDSSGVALTRSSVSSSDRKVDLPHLQSLELNINHSVDLMASILKHVTFLPTVKWNISSFAFQIGFSFGRDEDEESDSSYLKCRNLETIHRFMSEARFTFVNVLFSLDDDCVDLTLAERHGTGSRVNEPDGNRMVYQYGAPLYFANHWDSLMKSINHSGITRFHFVFSAFRPCDFGIGLDRMHTFLGTLQSRFFEHCRGFSNLPSFTISCWIKESNQYYAMSGGNDALSALVAEGMKAHYTSMARVNELLIDHQYLMS